MRRPRARPQTVASRHAGAVAIRPAHMRATLLAATLVVLGTHPAHPGQILYATAASENRIDGFCLGTDGSIAPVPKFQHDLGGTEPRRILVHPVLQNILYVAQQQRISTFRINADTGDIEQPTSEPVTITTQDPRDIAVFGDMLYASLHQGEVVGFRLNSAGIPMVNT